MADIVRALEYPYDIPKKSYLLYADGPGELADGAPLPDLTDRHPVIACGSNQSPQQLIRKFDDHHFATIGPIPVTRCRLENFDSVYSPHFSGYGSIAATLQSCAGVVVDLFITWLDDDQLRHMHKTEALGTNYRYAHLEDIRVDVDKLGVIDSVYAYIGLRGALRHDNQPVALAEISADGRRWTAMTQLQVQTVARDRLSAGQDLHQFIGQNIDRKSLRRHRTTTLAADALPFSYDGFRKLQKLPGDNGGGDDQAEIPV